MYLIPKYIRKSNIADNVIRYLWDDWKVNELIPADPDLILRFNGLSQRANLAFCTAASEWIWFRYNKLDDDPLPGQYLEAAWAMVVDFNYCLVLWNEDLNPEEWCGPVRRPIATAMEHIGYAAEQAQYDESLAWSSASLSRLAQYVINDPKPYIEWESRIIDRLESHYRQDPDDTLGDVVPREAMDPELDFDPKETEAQVNRFLGGLDYESNWFLTAPEKMLEEGFVGTPYVFSTAKDREMRFEW